MTDLEKLAGRIPRDRFWQLPTLGARDGEARGTGVEIEFSGLTEGAAAEVVNGLWGGTIRSDTAHRVRVDGTALGAIRIELDTALKDKASDGITGRLLDLSREVVPVEIVTGPLAFRDLLEIERLMDALKDAGAQGSEDGVLLAFGIHLNPEVAAESAEGIVPVVRAYAFVEQWLRTADAPDLSRRILPFIQSWPRAFIDRVAAEGDAWGLSDLCETYLELVASRNHGLDLLPLLEHLFPERVRAALPAGQVKGGRPTWHYRLPETALGDETWSFAYEWNRWVLVERVAADPNLLDDLAEAWRAHRAALTTIRPNWARDVSRLLEGAAVWDG